MNKITTYLLLFLAIYYTSSCSSDDSYTETDTIAGNWNMMRYEHSTNGENVNFIKGDIVWWFDEDTAILTVEIDYSQTTLENYESIYIGIDQGTYEYSINEVNGVMNLAVGDLEFGNITLSDNGLMINRKDGEFGNGNNLSTWFFEK